MSLKRLYHKIQFRITGKSAISDPAELREFMSDFRAELSEHLEEALELQQYGAEAAEIVEAAISSIDAKFGAPDGAAGTAVAPPSSSHPGVH